MDFDNLACKQNDAFFFLWRQNLETYAPERLALKLAMLHCNGKAVDAYSFANGSYNRCFRVKFECGREVIVRFSALGRSFLRREKIDDEVEVMSYIINKTPVIPVPKVWGKGWSAVGPYIVMDYIEGELLTEYIGALPTDKKRPLILNPNIGEATLEKAYREMAQLALAMFNCKFSHIGAIGQDGLVGKRAVTFNMNELMGLANYPPQMFATQRPLSTASQYFLSLANDHLTHLRMQRNDAVFDEKDCKEKYIARCLFRKIVREKFTSSFNSGPFRLYCDDFRPSNLIVDSKDLSVKAVIDWEYCYSAPAEFALCSPWWLLVARPDDWPGGFKNFLDQYLPRHYTFVRILKECEDAQGLPGSGEKPLSEHMQESMQNGLFWLCLAARSSYGFDDIYWEFLDETYFGKFTRLDDRLGLLSEEEQNELGPFVQLKMEQEKEPKLDRHQTLDEILEQ